MADLASVRREAEGPTSGQAIIVLGASTGGLEALSEIVAGLSPTIPAAICIVQHIGDHPSHLPALLAKRGSLPVREAAEGDPIESGRIYVAPPSHHLIVSDAHFHLTRGPRENFARPGIDPLFRSAAEHFGPRAIGVILTGQLNDGTAGLYEIRRRGGMAVVQDPADAVSEGMPRSALEHVGADRCVPVSDISTVLNELAMALSQEQPLRDTHGQGTPEMETQAFDRPVALTCPECGGAVRRAELGTLLKFDCHIGHSLTAEAMAAGQIHELERCLEASVRRLNERIELCRQMADHGVVDADGREKTAWRAALVEARDRAEQLIPLAETRWIQPQD